MDGSSVKVLLEKSSTPADQRRWPWQPPPIQEDLMADIETLEPMRLRQRRQGSGSDRGGTDAMDKATPDAPEVVPFRRVRQRVTWAGVKSCAQLLCTCLPVLLPGDSPAHAEDQHPEGILRRQLRRGHCNAGGAAGPGPRRWTRTRCRHRQPLPLQIPESGRLVLVADGEGM